MLGISIIPYNARFAPLLRQWLDDRGMGATTLKDLPEVGFVALMGDEAIAAGFLRRCEGGYAMIDSLVTNPEASGICRHEVLDIIMKNLICTAKSIGITALIGSSTDKNTILRAERLGFVACPHTLMSLKLEEETT